LSPDLALLDAGAAQGPLLKFEEKLPSPITERHGLGSRESSPALSIKFTRGAKGTLKLATGQGLRGS
jgi:hypothetical protein